MKDEILRQVGMVPHPFIGDRKGSHSAKASQPYAAPLVKPMVEQRQDGEAMFLPPYGSVNAKA